MRGEEGEEERAGVGWQVKHIIQNLAVPDTANHSKCRWSSGIHGCLTVGRGELDEHGFWERGCPTCARKHEFEHPEDGPVWPHKLKDIDRMFPNSSTQKGQEKCDE